MTPEAAGQDGPAGLQDELRYLLNQRDPIGHFNLCKLVR